jgi:uncharacterized membrane protein
MSGERREMRNWLRIALPISIVLNLFLLALVGGHVLRSRSNEFGTGTPLMRALARAEASLPPKDAAAFGAVMRREAPRFASAEQRLAEARRGLAEEITAERFDQAGVRQALEAWQAAWNGFFADFSGTLVEALGQVSPDGRRKLVADRRSRLESEP